MARRGLERGDDDEGSSGIDEEILHLPGPLDEARLHGLEEHEEVGDVLQEPRAQHPVGHLVERLRGGGEQARPVRNGQPAQQAAAEEVGHPARRVEDRQRVARRRRVDDHEVEVARRVEVVELFHREVLVAVHEAARDVLVQRIGEHRVASGGVGRMAADEFVPAGLRVEHRRPQLAAQWHRRVRRHPHRRVPERRETERGRQPARRIDGQHEDLATLSLGGGHSEGGGDRRLADAAGSRHEDHLPARQQMVELAHRASPAG